jgi:hypothetical protein
MTIYVQIVLRHMNLMSPKKARHNRRVRLEPYQQKNIINTYFTLDNQNMVTKVENQSLGITSNVSFRLQF